MRRGRARERALLERGRERRQREPHDHTHLAAVLSRRNPDFTGAQQRHRDVAERAPNRQQRRGCGEGGREGRSNAQEDDGAAQETQCTRTI